MAGRDGLSGRDGVKVGIEKNGHLTLYARSRKSSKPGHMGGERLLNFLLPTYLVSFAEVFWDVTQRTPQEAFFRRALRDIL